MSFGSEEHPRPEELLSFADGELSGKESAAVHAHLDACWQCRTELEHQQAAIRQFIDYRDQRITPSLPPWKANVVAFRQKLREVNASAGTSRSHSFVHRLHAMSTPGRAVATGLALASVAFLWYVARSLPAVTANELLTRAAQSEEQSSPRPLRQTVRLRAGRHSITEQVWRGTAVPAGASHSAWVRPGRFQRQPAPCKCGSRATNAASYRESAMPPAAWAQRSGLPWRWRS